MNRIIVLIINILVLFVPFSKSQIAGCTDIMAINYNSKATVNDGSCIYNSASVAVSESVVLPDVLHETSGLILWDNKFWTHNDSDDNNIYSFSYQEVNNYQTIKLTGTTNTDWEEISQDENYIYIGDFGNNANGNRQDLKILRIEKMSFTTNSLKIDTIHFNYSDQLDFSPAGPNNTDFDCEALIVSADSIYLITKQWLSNKTCLYSLPKLPGIYAANYLSTFDVGGLITGAVYRESDKLLVLVGYSQILQPFFYLFYDFSLPHFFDGNKRKIEISLAYHQVEGITTIDGLIYFISNEKLDKFPLNIMQKFHTVDLTSFLSNYLNNISSSVNISVEKMVSVYPVPSQNLVYINIESELLGKSYFLYDNYGRVILTGTFKDLHSTINIEEFRKGQYLLKVAGHEEQIFKIIKQ